MPGPSPTPRRRLAPSALFGVVASLPPALLGGSAAPVASFPGPLPLQFPETAQDEAALRQLAAKLCTSTDPQQAARSWAAAASPEEREQLLQAGLRAWGADPRLAELALLGLEAGLPAALPAAAGAGASSPLDKALRKRLHQLQQPPEELIEVCWIRGVFPDSASPAVLRAAFRTSALRLAEAGTLPRRKLAAALDQLPGPRPLLLPLCGFRLPDREIAGLLQVSTEGWQAADRLLLQLIHLDHAAAAAPAQVLDGIWREVRGLAGPVADWPPAAAALFQGLLRHSPWLPVSFPGPQALTSYPTGDVRQFLLGRVPLDRTWTLLLATLRDPAQSQELRKACAVRLIRGDGKAMAPLLVPLLAGELPNELAEFLIVGLGSFAGPELGQVLFHRERPFQGSAVRASLEHRLRQADHEERLRLIPEVLKLRPADRLGPARTAWEADPSTELLEVFQSWTGSPDPEVQGLARRLLRSALSEVEVAAFYSDRLAKERNPRLRELLVQSIRELRSDAALEVYLGWLDSVEGRAHPESGERAFLVVPETAAEAMFRRWWEQQDSLAPDQVDAAAAALAIRQPDAREYLYSRIPAFPVSKQVVLLDRLREGASATDFLRWRDGFLDSRADPRVRRAYAIDLAKTLPASQPQVDELLRFLAGKTRMGILPEGPWHDLIETVVALAPASYRRETLQLCLEVESGLGPAATRLHAARLRGMVREPLPEETQPLLDELLSLLAEPGPGGAPNTEVPQSSSVRNRNPLLYYTLLALGNHGAEADRALAERIDRAGPVVSSWAPEKLWFLAEQGAGRLPQSAAASRRWLEALEPPDSGLRETRLAWSSLPPRLWTDFAPVSAELQRRLTASAPLSGTAALLGAARKRWPEDRRCFDYSGWFAVAAGELDAAEAYFEQSRVRSGRSEQTQREPLLGMAVVDELRTPGCGAVDAFFLRDPGAAPLLPHRLAVGLRPDLAALLAAASSQ